MICTCLTVRKTLFKEHFAIIHDKMHERVKNEYREAEERHFHRDAEHFIEHAQEIEAHKHHGVDIEKMGWDHFKAQMHRFMEMKTKERAGLLEVAKHIF